MTTRPLTVRAMFPALVACGLACAVAGGSTAQAPASAPAPRAAPAPGAKPEAPKARRFDSADQLLTALETADRRIASLSSKIRISKTFSELEGGDKQSNFGSLMFISQPPAAGAAEGSRGRRMFQVDFDEVEFDKQRQPDKRSFVFDGRWYVERDPALKQIFKREIVPAGQEVDPLAIGQGPFWIPIGQRKEQILERFDAELLAPNDGFPVQDQAQLPMWVAQTVQLRLTPRAGVEEARRFREVRIWYRADDLIPRMARTIDASDATTEVFLTDVSVNQPLPKGAFDTKTPEGWTEDVQNYRGPAAGGDEPGEDK